MINYDEMAVKIHEQNKKVGWWDNPDRCIYEALQLISTEIAEATEAERKDMMDDHLPHRRGGEVELADALIRTLDLAGRYGWDFYDISVDNLFHGSMSIARRHMFINKQLVCLLDAVQAKGNELSCLFANSYYYSVLVASIVATADSQGYDIESAMLEKLEYNKTREDHKRENRARKGGKAF